MCLECDGWTDDEIYDQYDELIATDGWMVQHADRAERPAGRRAPDGLLALRVGGLGVAPLPCPVRGGAVW